MSRPSVDEMYMNIARVVATRATCDRLKVGAVITNWSGETVWSIGYNGAARGLPNGCERPHEPGNCGCTLHAEINCLIKCYYGDGDLIMYVTHSPCLACAKAILNSRVKRVVYGELYRSTEGINLLVTMGVEVRHVEC